MKIVLNNIHGMILIAASLIFIGCEKNNKGLPVDGDGNVYDTVVIGTQTWLKQNLKTTKYYNGVSIPLVTDNTEWSTKTSAAFCWYNNDSKYKENYGALYNWYVVRAGTLCPVGYHVATKDEWTTMINYLGESMAGAKIKDNSPGFWIQNNECATNATGFTAHPSGMRYDLDGLFYGIGEYFGCWTSSLAGLENNSIYVSLTDGICETQMAAIEQGNAFSVRCIINK
jgi:uncharacterized protein (TIGR02145 family)